MESSLISLILPYFSAEITEAFGKVSYPKEVGLSSAIDGGCDVFGPIKDFFTNFRLIRLLAIPFWNVSER